MNNSIQKHENPLVFYDRFSRCRRLLHFTAVRVLRSSERAEEAVQNTFATASQNPPRFKSEGAFHCWLIRILIDEALLILRQDRSMSATTAVQISEDGRRSLVKGY